jgi:hypothetical protein
MVRTPRHAGAHPLVVLSNNPLRRYQPLREETGLFRTLAETPDDDACIVGFAGRYGLLGIGADAAWWPADEAGKWLTDVQGFILGPSTVWEVVTDWRPCIRWLNALVGLWDLARGGADALDCSLVWDNAGVSYYPLPTLDPLAPKGRGRLLTTAQLREYGVERGDLVGAAHVVLAAALNTQLRQAPAGLGWDPAQRRPFVSARVDSLWGAVCLQFVNAIAGNKEYGRCRACGRWYELSPELNRTNRMTCSDPCRQKAHRERHRRARELHAEGKSASEIAREVGSSVEAVRRWVSGKKGS